MKVKEIINLSAEPINKLYSWLPHDLEAEKVVFLPDACPGKSPLPTGTVVKMKNSNWRKFAISDVGCGMRLLRTNVRQITNHQWNKVAMLLKSRKGKLGDLGGGNHFLDALLPYSEENIYFLIHTGSRKESMIVDKYIDNAKEFDRVFSKTLKWAFDNRSSIQEVLEIVFGKLEIILDLPHNTYEYLKDGSVIIRKGAVKVEQGELNIIPSNLGGDVSLVRATERIKNILNSLSHGTGRIVPRRESKKLAENYDFSALRKRVLMPECIQIASLKTEGPYAYRDLDVCLQLLNGYIEEVERFSVIAYIGHL